MTSNRIEQLMIALWVVLVTSASLNEVVPYMHWFVTAPLLLALTFNGQFSASDFRVPGVLLTSAALLSVAVLAVSLVSGQTLYDLLQSAKLSVILLAILPVIVSKRLRRDALWAGAEAAVYWNIALIVGGLTISPVLFSLQGFARFGTYANSPGALWRVGAIGIAAALNVRDSKSRFGTLRSVCCMIGSIALVALDGSRTGFLVLTAALLLYLPGMLRACSRKPARVLSFLVLFGTGLAVLLAVAPQFDEIASQYGAIARLQHEMEASGSGHVSADGLDTTRSDMYHTVVEAVKEHPIIGSGMGRTVVQTEVGPMVVHCSFLQVWADVGLFGFIGYSMLLILALSIALVRRIRARPDGKSAALRGIYLTCTWTLAGCFHPISTELSEWIWFILAISMIANCSFEKHRQKTPMLSLARLTFYRTQPACA